MEGHLPWAESATETYSTQLCAAEIQLTNQPTNQIQNFNEMHFCAKENRCPLLWLGIPITERLTDI